MQELVQRKVVATVDVDQVRTELGAAEVRRPRTQPAERRWAGGAVKIRNLKPQTETRGIRGYREKLALVEAITGLRVAPVLVGSAVLTFAGREEGVTLSTIVLEKTRDIAILKSMGFHARDVRLIFLFEGVIIGVIGSLFGLALGAGLMHVLSLVQIKPPGVSEKVFLPI
jgi:lipoprotein-releasing system permease protein